MKHICLLLMCCLYFSAISVHAQEEASTITQESPNMKKTDTISAFMSWKVSDLTDSLSRDYRIKINDHISYMGTRDSQNEEFHIVMMPLASFDDGSALYAFFEAKVDGDVTIFNLQKLDGKNEHIVTYGSKWYKNIAITFISMESLGEKQIAKLQYGNPSEVMPTTVHVIF